MSPQGATVRPRVDATQGGSHCSSAGAALLQGSHSRTRQQPKANRELPKQMLQRSSYTSSCSPPPSSFSPPFLAPSLRLTPP